jgi:hypothetical protein
MKNKTSYINSWNYFSKAVFLKNNLKKTALFLVEDFSSQKKYSEIFKFLGINFRIIDNYSLIYD